MLFSLPEYPDYDSKWTMSVTDLRIRDRLRHTWQTFFGRWGRLTAIQRMAIPFILERHSLLLNAPTASGKTEAVVAPLTEKMIEEAWPEGSIIYITPTRALVNDLYHRLEPLYQTLGLSIARRTGDFHEFNQNRMGHLNLMTPESFDSILCRIPQKLLETKAIILDELHMIDGTPRGEQLRLLIRRFSWIRERHPAPLVKYGLSATVPDPVSLGKRYLGDSFKVVRAPHQRAIDLIGLYPTGETHTMALTIQHLLKKYGFKKVLLFTNAKSHAEEVASALKQTWGYPEYVFVHHGRLDRKIRLAIEHAFHHAPVGICVATSTLEVGVDIGGIDAIGLLALPHSPESFIQRIGRGRRKAGTIPVFAFYRDDLEEAIYKTYLNLVNRETFPQKPVSPLPLAFVQQLLSYVVQKRRVGTSLQAVSRLMSDLKDHPYWQDRYLDEWLEYLEQHEWLERQHGLIYPGRRLFRAFEKGWIHSTIDEVNRTIQVVNEQGQHLTEILVESLPAPGTVLVIAGRLYRVVRILNEKVIVTITPHTAEQESAPYPTAPPIYWDYPFGRILLENLFPGIPEGTVPVQTDGRFMRIVHGFGYIISLIWSHALADMMGWKVLQIDGIQTAFETDGNWPSTWKPTPSIVKRTIHRFRGPLEHWFGENRYYALMTPSLKQLHLLLAIHWFDFENYLESLTFARIKNPLG